MEGGFSQAEQCRSLLDDRIGRSESDAEKARLLVLRARISSTESGDDAVLEAAYLEALALNADYGPALLGLAQLMRARGDDQSAFGYFARLLEGSTGDVDEPMRLVALNAVIALMDALGRASELGDFVVDLSERFPADEALQQRIQECLVVE